MPSWNQDVYIRAWNFASRFHKDQFVPGSDLPYINHIGAVAMEVVAAVTRGDAVQNPDLAIQCALLHDAIEDTDATREVLESEFGKQVADGVLALTKNEELPTKEEKMGDSLERIQAQPREIWMVKMADRITNLQPPPHHWNKEKIRKYREEALRILESLQGANRFLADRLREKIATYGTREKINRQILSP